MHKVEIVEIDGELGFALPAEICEKLKVRPGDKLDLVPVTQGMLRLTVLQQPDTTADALGKADGDAP
ncbi:hypothetical protein [Variovorax sp. OV329]|uniref:hypothetical protein n=1 Tax=Variovorax sp. OV329 TaxID=1882825 RepID=UPI0008EE2F6A|nr:hypothetical protein [Variovorax sp. OV329]SFM87595.1 hypothetical protein SAMN05444747_11094 [Variovorax sp. OV329]